MSKWIDADALKAFIRNQYFQCDMPEEWGNGVMWATSQINHYCNKVAPSIDICFCRECKKSHIDGKTTHYLWCTEWGRSTDTFGYCERGEREDE